MLLLAIPFLFTACKDEDEEPPRIMIYMDNGAFNPSTGFLPSGGTVIWQNDDTVVHTVTSNTGLFTSGDIAPEKSYSYTFPDTGTYHYHCEHHGVMQGTILVQQD